MTKTKTIFRINFPDLNPYFCEEVDKINLK